jgi:hypothetical protein
MTVIAFEPLREPDIGILPDLNSPGSKPCNSLLLPKKFLKCFRILGRGTAKIGCILLFLKALVPLAKISPSNLDLTQLSLFPGYFAS